jgi:hypothetical protein
MSWQTNNNKNSFTPVISSILFEILLLFNYQK